MAGEKENVAIFNPLILSLPSWHPDGPDGTIDGYLIPFVFPEREGRRPNRDARLRVYPSPHGWRTQLLNCQDHAETPAQARAFAGAWIRAAELLDAQVLREAQERAAAEDTIVDAEVVEQCESQSSAGRECVRDDGHEEIHLSADGWTWRRDADRAYLAGDDGGDAEPLRKPPRLPGEPLSDMLSESDPPAALHPDDHPRAGCPACKAGTCTLHGGDA